MSQITAVIKCCSLKSRFIRLCKLMLFEINVKVFSSWFADLNWHFINHKEPNWNIRSSLRGNKYDAVKRRVRGWAFHRSLWRFTKHLHLSIFSPLHPWQTVESVYFQTLLFLLYFTFIKRLSGGLDLHPSVYELTLNRWGEETEESKDKEQQPLSNLWSLFCERYVLHALTSLISFIYWHC